ncbi:MAG: efflux RND transporter periplasmic adaptor subunit [Bryobacteraceae bacterium]
MPPSTHTETSSVAVETPRHPASSAHGHYTPQPTSGKKSKAWIWLVILVVILAAGYFMYNQYQAMQQQETQRRNRRPQSVPVTTARAQKSDMNVYVEALGTVTPIYTDTITSRVSGQIVDIHYREGQMVHKGDPLIDIDARPYEAAVTQMSGQLAKDKALLAEAQLDLDRYQTAYSRNAIAKQQLDDQTQLVHQDEGTVQNDEGQLENARVNLAYTHITSPIDGRVGLRLVDMGNIVQANSTTALVVVTQLQPITVIFSVDQGYLGQIGEQLRQGHKMGVEALDRNQETKIADGTLLTLDNQVDVSTDTVKLRASFSNSDGKLFPNAFVNARLLLNTQRGDTVVPTNAIQRNAQGAFVYVIGPDETAKVQNVTAGVSDDNMTAVQGIQPGAVVATTGFNQLQDGIKVTLPGHGRGARGNRTADSNPASGENAR